MLCAPPRSRLYLPDGGEKRHLSTYYRGLPVSVVGCPGQPMLVIADYGGQNEQALGVVDAPVIDGETATLLKAVAALVERVEQAGDP